LSSANNITGGLTAFGMVNFPQGLTVGAGGIQFADGTSLTTETQIAFKNEQNTFTDNQFFTATKGIGADGDDLGIKFNANQIVVIGDPEDAANSVKLTVDDNDGVVKVENANFDIPTSIRHLGDTNTKIQFGTDTVDFDAGGREGMKLTSTETQFNNGITVTGAAQFNGGVSVTGSGLTLGALTELVFGDGTTQDTAHRGENTATFSIHASSAISTGSKTDTLFRVPYNATFKQLQIRSGATGGFTGSFTIAGSDFGAVTTNSIHGATLGTLGFTASSTSFDFASATAGDFLFFNVGSNGAGATTVQAFVTFERR
jgi:hypothetical protein